MLLAPREEVWALVSEPFHLPDWWPAYTGVEPDRRGWRKRSLERRPQPPPRIRAQAARKPDSSHPPGGHGAELSLHDHAQKLDMGIRLRTKVGRRRRQPGFEALVALLRRGSALAAAAGSRPPARPLPDSCF